jgi:two-component system, chemotaxis family, chemotaxis protein CheY
MPFLELEHSLKGEYKMKKVLVVDDAAFMRLAIRNILDKGGFEVVGEAENGVDAIQKYKELQPDIVTMDITMPVMTGVDALKNIIQYDPKAKVVMLSAMGQENLVKECILSGAKTFLVKPVKDEQVVLTLNKLLAV